MQLIATGAANVIDNRDAYLGTELEIAGDELTFTEVAEIYGKVTGVPVEGRMFEWFAESGYQADLPNLRVPGLLTFNDRLTEQLH